MVYPIISDEILEQNPDLKADYLDEVEQMKTAALAEQERLLERKKELELELASSSKDTTESVVESKSEFGILKAAIDNATIQSLDDESHTESIKESASLNEAIKPQQQNETASVDVNVNTANDDKDDDISIEVTPTPESSISLPPPVKEFLDKYIPPSIQLMIRNVSIKMYRDIRRLLRLQLRICRALVAQLLQRIEEYKAAKNANSS
jgi:hypothetical protein